MKCGRKFTPLLGKKKEPGSLGRPPVAFRKVMNGILFVLRTGCHWKAIPRCFGSGSTVHRRFQQWTRVGIMDVVVGLLLRWYDRRRGIDWEWQAADTKLLATPLGGEATEPNPTDLGKCGTKRHLLVDGRDAPLAVHLSGANRHDLKGSGLLTPRPEPSEGATQHLCLDKAYDAEEAERLLEELDYEGHIKRRGHSDEPGVGKSVYPARRWSKLRARWEKKGGKLPGSVAASRRAHHLSPDSFGIGFYPPSLQTTNRLMSL